MFKSPFLMAFVASAVILAVLVVRPFFKKFSNRLACLLWIVVLFRLLCPFTIVRPALIHAGVTEGILVDSQASDTEGLEINHVDGKVENRAISNAANDPTSNATSDPTSNATSNSTSNSTSNATINPTSNAVNVATNNAVHNSKGDFAWVLFTKCKSAFARFTESDAGRWMRMLCGMAWLFGTILFSILGFCKYQRTRKMLKEASFLTTWHKFPVKVSNVQGVPMSFGILKPGIYVPESFAEASCDGLSDDQRKMILMHEEMHLRHCDPLWKVVAFLALAAHWWNPLAWIAVRCMNQDLEMACDENVLHRMGCEHRQEYATTIFEFAKRRDGTFLASAFGESPAEKRIRNVVRYHRPSAWLSAVLICGILILGGCLASSPAFGATEKTAEGMDTEDKTDAGLEADNLKSKDSGSNNLKLENLKSEDMELEGLEQAFRVLESDQEVTEGMTVKELIQKTDQLSHSDATDYHDDVINQWKQKQGEIIVLDEIPDSETYLYGVNERGMAKLFLRVGDSVYPLDWGMWPLEKYNIGRQEATDSDQTMFFLIPNDKISQNYYPLYTIEVKKDKVMIYPFTQKEEILSKVNVLAEKMGYRVTKAGFGCVNRSERTGIQYVVSMEGVKAAAEYNIEVHYLGKGLYEIDKFQLITDMGIG